MPDTINRTRLFTGCVVALVATAFGFAVRAAILDHWRVEFNLSQEQIGYILGAGLFPFAISIILFSLIIDRLGNGVSMAIAFTLHALSAVITLAAPFVLADPGAGPEAVLAGQRNGFSLLYLGTFIFALGNGTVEAVVNPVTATLFDREKTKYFNILHAGWPGGLVLGGLVAIAVSFVDPARVPGRLWQWQVGLVLVPTLAYGLMLLGQRFPVQERVAANVPYYEMLREFGAGSCFVVCFFLVAGLNQILVILGVPTFALAAQLGIAFVLPRCLRCMSGASGGRCSSFSSSSWCCSRRPSLAPTAGSPTSCAPSSRVRRWARCSSCGHRSSCSCSGSLPARSSTASVRWGCSPPVPRSPPLGLFWLSKAGTSPAVLFAAATFYGLGKTFFWPTTLGVVSEQYPRGGALMLNAIAGVGMISVGTIGNPAIGAVQDRALVAEIRAADPALARAACRLTAGPFRRVVGPRPAARTRLAEELAASTARSGRVATGSSSGV